jgi:hypothetical protein
LRKVNINGFPFRKPKVEGVIDLARAFLGTRPAGDAFSHVDITGALPDGHRETAEFTLEMQHVRQRVHMDSGMPADLDQLGR